MSKTSKSALFSSVFAVYSKNLIRRRFESFHASGLTHLVNTTSTLPLIIYCNHSSWWDGIIVFQLMRIANLDGFILMEDRQLDAYPLFKRFGAIPIARNNPRKALSSLKSVGSLLAATKSGTVTIFPQGQLVPPDRRPLVFETGIARLIKFAGACETASVAIQFRFASSFKPEIFISIGSRRRFASEGIPSPRVLTDELRRDLTVNLEDLNERLTHEVPGGFTKLI